MTADITFQYPPELFNLLVERFITDVERGSWRPRDPRATPLRL